MMPRTLRMEAFGPYAEAQMVDFRPLAKDRFFLIHGPTGSGKTTLLDAIAFALYGDSSGGMRRGAQMRSDHAPPSRRTEVEFEFELGRTVYRVTRSPEWQREKKRGDGTVREESQATLYRLSANSELELLASGALKVTQKVVELLGFESDQFRQVVLLPQNQFNKFLLAGSKEREGLLEMLFRTERYRRLQDRLDAEAKALAASARDREAQRQGLLLSVGVETTEALSVLEAALLAERELLSTRRAREEEARTVARAALESAKAELRLFAELDGAIAAEAQLNAGRVQLEAKEQELERARRAVPLLEKESQLEALKRRQIEALAQAERQRAKEAAARAQLAEAEKHWHRAQADEPARLALEMQWQQMLQKQESVLQWENALKAFGRVTKASDEAKAAGEIKEKYLADLRLTLEKARTERPRLENLAQQVEWLEPALTAAKAEQERRQRVSKLRGEEAPILKAAEDLKRQLAQVKAQGERQREKATRVERSWMEGQAATLAAALVAGAPCPVCGGCEHPQPALAAGGERPPTGEEVTAERAELERLQKAWLETRGRLETEERRLAVLQVEVRALGEIAQDEKEPPEAKILRLSAELEKARAAQKRLPEIDGRMAQLQAEEARGVADGETLRLRRESLSRELQEARTAVDQIRGSLGGEVFTIAEWEKKIHTLQTQIAKSRELWESARERREKAALAKASADEARAGAEALLSEVTAEERSFRVLFLGEITGAGFVDFETYARARRSREAMARLEEEIRWASAARSSAADRRRRADAAVAGKTRPELAPFESRLAELEVECTNISRALGAVETRIAQVEKTKAGLTALAGDLDALSRQYGLVGRMAEVAKGDNPTRINFQRYVLSAFLEEILEMASHRLQTMSRGRFLLRRALKGHDGRMSGGLDLEVEDGYTGVSRPANTLSGGEGFLASLALALGLSDVVQAHAGGIRLDAIFVDEGFGTLDPEALDLAIRTLMDLQKGGRLVGIISHVPELRGLIRSRIEITPERAGSRAEVIVP